MTQRVSSQKWGAYVGNVQISAADIEPARLNALDADNRAVDFGGWPHRGLGLGVWRMMVNVQTSAGLFVFEGSWSAFVQTCRATRCSADSTSIRLRGIVAD